MTNSESRRRIGIFCHGGTQNLGDEALFAAVIQNVRLRLPDATVIGFTINPKDSQERHGIPCFPIRRTSEVESASSPNVPCNSTVSNPSEPTRNRGVLARLKRLVRAMPGLRLAALGTRRFVRAVAAVLAEPRFLVHSYRRLSGIELLLVAGSQQLNDGYGGAWGFPYTLLKWTLLCKFMGTKIAILSVGAGPIDSPISKFFFRRALNWVEYRSYRDAFSSRLIQNMGVRGSHPVFPDLAYSLRFAAPAKPPEKTSLTIVGINPVPYYDNFYWYSPDPARYNDYVQKFARFSDWLVKTGHGVLFFPTQTRADVLTINDIHVALNGSSQSLNILPRNAIRTFEDLISEISRADIVIANRYHGILISLILNKPVLAVAYHEKSRALLEQVGQGEYVLDIKDFKTEDLIERLKAMEANATTIRARIAESMAPLQEALQAQYDTVLGLIGVKGSGSAVT